MEESDEIGEESSEGEIEYFPKIEDFNIIDNYQPYTINFDEVYQNLTMSMEWPILELD